MIEKKNTLCVTTVYCVSISYSGPAYEHTLRHHYMRCRSYCHYHYYHLLCVTHYM